MRRPVDFDGGLLRLEMVQAEKPSPVEEKESGNQDNQD
jgi:hypothetical protein